MSLNNPWVSYITRSHLQIKNSILKRVGELVPEMTDHSESNILVVLISMFSGIAEMLNYYIDNMAREAFISTARRYSSVVKHTRLIDYRIKAAIPSSVDLTINFLTSLDLPEVVTTEFTIPAGTIFKTENNIEFISLTDTICGVDITNINIPCQQKTFSSTNILGETSGLSDEIFSIGSDYAHNSILLKIDNELWDRQETLGRSGSDDKHYIIEISADQVAYVKLGDDINGKRPDAGKQVLADFYTTLGDAGNVDTNTIISSDFDFNTTSVTKASISNTLPSVAGTNYESIERIRRSAPLSLRTLDRAVTKQDYEDIAKLSDGVDKAIVNFDCGKFVNIYISPNGGGIASTDLLSTTKQYIEDRKMITTFINVVPTGQSNIVVDLEISPKKRIDPILTKSDTIAELLDKMSYGNSDINKSIRKSDIISLVDNLDKVDFVNLKLLNLKPYIRPKEHTKIMSNNIIMRSGSTQTTKWLLQFDGTRVRLSTEGVAKGNIEIGEEFIEPGNNFAITITDNNYTLGEEWEFTTYAYNNNIELEDYTIPVLTLANLNITMI